MLECDGPVYATGVLEGDEGGGSTPEKALAAFPRGPQRPLPLHGYRALERTADSVLFAYENNDRIRAAIRVERDAVPLDGGDTVDPWTFTSYAGCDPVEFAPSADDEIGIDLVRRVDGTRFPARLLHMRADDQHCSAGASSLVLGQAILSYVRDPRHAYRGEVLVSYEEDVALPAAAVDSGLRTGKFALFAAPDPTAIYAVASGHVERWPARIPRPMQGPCG